MSTVVENPCVPPGGFPKTPGYIEEEDDMPDFFTSDLVKLGKATIDNAKKTQEDEAEDSSSQETHSASEDNNDSPCAKICKRGVIHALSHKASEAKSNFFIDYTLEDLAQAVVRDNKVPMGLDLVKRIIEVTKVPKIFFEYKIASSSLGAFWSSLSGEDLVITCVDCNSKIDNNLIILESHFKKGTRTRHETQQIFFKIKGDETISLRDLYEAARNSAGLPPRKKKNANTPAPAKKTPKRKREDLLEEEEKDSKKSKVNGSILSDIFSINKLIMITANKTNSIQAASNLLSSASDLVNAYEEEAPFFKDFFMETYIEEGSILSDIGLSTIDHIYSDKIILGKDKVVIGDWPESMDGVSSDIFSLGKLVYHLKEKSYSIIEDLLFKMPATYFNTKKFLLDKKEDTTILRNIFNASFQTGMATIFQFAEYQKHLENAVESLDKASSSSSATTSDIPQIDEETKMFLKYISLLSSSIITITGNLFKGICKEEINGVFLSGICNCFENAFEIISGSLDEKVSFADAIVMLKEAKVKIQKAGDAVNKAAELYGLVGEL
jgi:hypothetical protein